MALKVTKHHAHMEDHGEDWRIERRFIAEPNGEHFWVVYEREKAKEVSEGARTYRLHPHHKTETAHTHIWMPRFAGPEDKARAFLTKHAK